jgi:multiple antibiotic resistance protein
MVLNFKEIATASMVLFAVIDIVGSVPVIIGLRNKVGHIQSEKASVVAAIIMIAFLFVGEKILKLIGIDVSSFAVAGSLIIFFLAIEMVLGITLYKDDVPETASIVPIAFPLIAGAGTITTLLSLRAEYEVQNIIVAIDFCLHRAQVLYKNRACARQKRPGRYPKSIRSGPFGDCGQAFCRQCQQLILIQHCHEQVPVLRPDFPFRQFGHL